MNSDIMVSLVRFREGNIFVKNFNVRSVIIAFIDFAFCFNDISFNVDIENIIISEDEAISNVIPVKANIRVGAENICVIIPACR